MPAFESAREVEEVKGASNRKFGVTVGAVLMAAGLWPLVRSHDPRWWAVVLGLVLVIAALVRPETLIPLNKGWMNLGTLIGKVMTPFVMSILLYVVLAPVGLMQRLFGRDQLHLKWDPEAKSYWEFRNPPGPPPESMKNQF